MRSKQRTKKRPVIALDLDGVVYDFQGTYCYLMSTHRGVEFPGPMDEWWTDWNAPDTFTTQEDRDWIWSKGVGRFGLFKHGHVIKGAVDGVRELASHGDILVVTHRPQTAVRDTLAFLAYRDLPIVGVHVTQGPKSLVEADVFVDDGPHVIKDLCRAGRPVVVFDRPYNRDLLSGEDEETQTAIFTAALDNTLKRAWGWNDVPVVVADVLRQQKEAA